MTDARAAAARCLAAVSAKGASLSRQIGHDEQRLKPAQRPLYRELCYGSLRYYWRLHALVKPLLKKPLKAKDQDVLMLMLIGAYQLEYMRVPPHAALNASVDACQKLGKPWAKGLVNAVLRRLQRENTELLADLSPAAQAAHPEWLYQRLQQAWPQQLEQIIAANNSHPPLSLRVNQREVSRQEYLDVLDEHDIAASACAHADWGVQLAKPVPVEQLPGFAEGWVSVQDESAQLAAQLLGGRDGERILDACAAPGGKTCHILEAAPQAHVIALDVDDQRLSRVSDNLERLELQAELLCADATDTDSWWNGEAFDRILLDAPCSATGVMRRNPDIKLHRRAEDIAALSQLQGDILTALWPTLKPGGLLLYATCSVLPEENTDSVQHFLATHDDARLMPLEVEWGLAQSAGRQILPTENGGDGFFYALLQKIGP